MRLSPPNCVYVRSTCSISPARRFAPRYSPRCPPTSVESVSFPSEKAPAPPQPLTSVQGEQGGHCTPLIRAGQRLRASSGPFSSTNILKSAVLARSKAVKMPAGPLPTMITSHLSSKRPASVRHDMSLKELYHKGVGRPFFVPG